MLALNIVNFEVVKPNKVKCGLPNYVLDILGLEKLAEMRVCKYDELFLVWVQLYSSDFGELRENKLLMELIKSIFVFRIQL